MVYIFQVEGVSTFIRDAIKKEKLRREYKQHTVNVTSKNRQRQKQASQNNRLKIISSFRNIELEELDKNDSKKCNFDLSKSDTNSIDDRLVPVSENESRTNGATVSSSNSVMGTNEKVYQLLDVEVDMPSVMPTFESLLKVSSYSGISMYYYTCTCSFL